MQSNFLNYVGKISSNYKSHERIIHGIEQKDKSPFVVESITTTRKYNISKILIIVSLLNAQYLKEEKKTIHILNIF